MRFIILIISFLAAQQLLAQTEVHTIKVRKKPLVRASEQSVPSGVFRVVENMPYLNVESCNGTTPQEQKKCGDIFLQKFVASNLKYPNEAREIGIEGQVIVSFIIRADGTMTDLMVIRDIGGGCAEESLRVVKLISEKYKWMPGTQRGQAVDVLYNLPVIFKLD